MISVIVPTLNAQESLGLSFGSLVSATVQGLVREVIVSDGGSHDDSAAIAEAAGARLVSAPRGRGPQLAAGADAARQDWLLFLHADTCLEPGWESEVAKFIERSDMERPQAAYFRFALDDFSSSARCLEAMVALRCRLFALPYGDQGLLIPRRLYRKLGGYRPLALMEDVDIVRRLGRRRLVALRARAVTSAERYRHDGYLTRSVRNLLVLLLHVLRVPASVLSRLYG